MTEMFCGEGARGSCFFEIRKADTDEHAILDVGWSCVHVHSGEIPITWLSELIAIATAHKEGIAGFLKQHDYGLPSYALMCNPDRPATPRLPDQGDGG